MNRRVDIVVLRTVLNLAEPNGDKNAQSQGENVQGTGNSMESQKSNNSSP